MTTKNIETLFVKLLGFPGQSGQEKAIAEYILDYYQKLGWQTWQDDSGKHNDSTAGNVYALLETDPNKPTLMFAAHMDTVAAPGQSVKVIVEADKVSSDGTTILGADDRAGVATILAASTKLNKTQLNHNILCFFSTREEAGQMGSTFFKPHGAVRYIFNVDSDDTPGVFITQSMGYQNFDITVRGRAAHAAKEYELGIDAIRASGYLIGKLPKAGSRKAGWTCNVGSVYSNTGMTNVIPEKTTLEGEIRAYRQATFDMLRAVIAKAARETTAKFGVTVDVHFDDDDYIVPFAKSKDPSIFDFCRQAASTASLKPVFKKSYSTSDSNNFSRHGIPTVSLASGGQKSHAKDESILLSELADTVRLLQALMLGKVS